MTSCSSSVPKTTDFDVCSGMEQPLCPHAEEELTAGAFYLCPELLCNLSRASGRVIEDFRWRWRHGSGNFPTDRRIETNRLVTFVGVGRSIQRFPVNASSNSWYKT